MTLKERSRIIAGLALIFVSSPIWFYLLYKTLIAINATDLMWFLYWIYVPVSVFAAVVARIASDGND